MNFSILLYASDLAKYASMNPFCTDEEVESQFWATNQNLSNLLRNKRERKHDSSVSKLVCGMGEEERKQICIAMNINKEKLEKKERQNVEEKEERRENETDEERKMRKLETEKEVAFQIGRAIARQITSHAVLPASNADTNSEMTRILQTLDKKAVKRKEEEERNEEETLNEEEKKARQEKHRLGTECLGRLSVAVESDARMKRGTKREADSLDSLQLEKNIHVQKRNSKKMGKNLFSFRLEEGRIVEEGEEDIYIPFHTRYSARIVGVVDGVVSETGEVVEAKERRYKLFRHVVDYEKVQLHCYMFLTNSRSSILRERFDGQSMDHKVLFDDSFWNECIDRTKLFLERMFEKN